MSKSSTETLNTYHVSGTLEKESPLPDTSPDRKFIYREVEAYDQQEALDQFDVNGWEWADEPGAWLVTEAAKLERSGGASLFPLPPKGIDGGGPFISIFPTSSFPQMSPVMPAVNDVIYFGVDTTLRAAGYDPDEVGARMKAAADEALAVAAERINDETF